MGVVGFLCVYIIGYSQKCVTPATTAYVMQVCLGSGFFFVFNLVADERFYHEAAVNLAEAWRQGDSLDAQIGITKASFIWLLGGLYFLMGPHPLVGILFNAALLGLVPSLIAASCRRFRMQCVARTAAWIAALVPQLVFWAPWLRREALAFFLLSTLVLAMGFLFERRYVLGSFVLAGVVVALSVTRAQLVAVAVAGALAALIASRGPTPRTLLLHGSTGAAVVAVVAVFMTRFVPQPVYQAITGPLNAPELQAILSETAGDTENLRVDGVSASFNLSPTGFTVNLLRTIAGPFPWEWKNLAWVVTGLDGIFFLLVMVLSIWVLRVCPDQRRQVVVLLVATVPLLVGTALLLGNYGIAMRIRAHFLPFLIPIIALGVRHFWFTQGKSRYLIDSQGLRQPVS